MFNLQPYIFLLFLLITGISASHANESELVVTPEIAFKAIDRYQRDPASPDALTLIAIIVRFAEQSDDVLVKIDSKYLPSEFETAESHTRSHILGSYIAGNVKYQLQHDVKADQPIEGVLFMLKAYTSLRNAEKVERLPTFEDWLVKAEKEKLTF